MLHPLNTARHQRIAQAVANLDAWLDSMRVPQSQNIPYGGYGGPVVHWWQNCLSYTGPGLDWRYEGIIQGYLAIWNVTHEHQWLDKVCGAADDLVRGQLSNGNFVNSSFEQNPYTGGTPHEAGDDVGLLKLALQLQALNDDRWQVYAKTAENNLREYYIGRLWDDDFGGFYDHPREAWFVPNKACTLVEALFAWAELRGTDEPIAQYALPTLRKVLESQADSPVSVAGGTPQALMNWKPVPAYFPYYNSRCVPALLLAYLHTGEQQWLDTAIEIAEFISRHIDVDGLLPQVVYLRGINRYPQWVSPLGDVLRALRLLSDYGYQSKADLVEVALLNRQMPTGGIPTGYGFGQQIRQRKVSVPPDFRDFISVVGWVDKAFRYLATQLLEQVDMPDAEYSQFEAACHVRGNKAVFTETQREVRISTGDKIWYQWQKDQPWASVEAPEVMWK